jgi:hypothetical protein
MAYSPNYLTTDEIPVQIPDDYSESKKLEALEVAEAEAELDLNDGEKLLDLPSTILPKVKIAIKQKATAELIEAAEDPDDVTLGDLDDSGTNKSDYGDIFSSQYDDIIMKIRNSDALDDTQDDSAYVYTTHQGNGNY